MSGDAHFVTIDAYPHSVIRALAWRRTARRALAAPLPGLTAATINHANTGTFTVVSKVVGSCLVLTWSSADAAHEAWAGPLDRSLGGPGALSLDGEVTRARTRSPTTSTAGALRTAARRPWPMTSRWPRSSTAS